MALKPNERIEDIVEGDRYLKLSGIKIGTIALVTDRADDALLGNPKGIDTKGQRRDLQLDKRN